MKHKLAIFLSLVVLQAGDLLSTRLAFAHGAVELNPLVHTLGLWPAKLLVVAAAGFVLFRATRLHKLWIVVSIYAGIVGWNLLLVAKVR